MRRKTLTFFCRVFIMGSAAEIRKGRISAVKKKKKKLPSLKQWNSGNSLWNS